VQRHREPAKDVRRDPCGKSRSGDSRSYVMVGEPSQNQLRETERGDLRTVSCLYGNGVQGSAENE